MSYNLFLDDMRYPKDVKWIELPLVEWTIVRNYKEFGSFVEELSALHPKKTILEFYI